MALEPTKFVNGLIEDRPGAGRCGVAQVREVIERQIDDLDR
jgi:hypothetical protein